MAVHKCEVYKNHQAGLQAREGGTLSAFQNKIFSGGFHGVLIGPNAGECLITRNKLRYSKTQKRESTPVATRIK